MATILDRLKRGLAPTKQMLKDSMDWFSDKINDLSNAKFRFTAGHSSHSAPLPGTMMFFSYPNPKYRKTLPFWDLYPLVLPFNVRSDRFWGLNLHYLPIDGRVALLSALRPLVVDSRISNQKKMILSWELINKYAGSGAANQTVKQYLLTGNHVGSAFTLINSSEWDYAAIMPRERFVTESLRNGKRKRVNARERVWR